MKYPSSLISKAKLGSQLVWLLSFFFVPSLAQSALKEWTGLGPTNLASHPANWSDNTAPVENDQLLFSALGTGKNCVINFTFHVSELTLASGYSGVVSAGADLDLGKVTVQSGEFRMGAFDHGIAGDFIHTGGSFSSALNGTVRFGNFDTQAQRIWMKEGSYFFNFRVLSSSAVILQSDLWVDGNMSLGTGELDAARSTITMTGGSLVGAGDGPQVNWSDIGGFFKSGNGLVRFDNGERVIRINQKSSNRFNEVIIEGSQSIEVVSNLNVNGPFHLHPTAAITLDMGAGFDHHFYGWTWLGPSQNASIPEVKMGFGGLTFHSSATIESTRLLLAGGDVGVLGSELTFGQGSALEMNGSGLSRVLMGNKTFLNFNGGRLTTRTSGRIAPFTAGHRYSTMFNGDVDIDSQFTVAYTDVNGMRFGAGANPIALNNISFIQSAPGGAAFNFDPLVASNVLIDTPDFDASVSTNIRVIVGPGLFPNFNVVNPQGMRNGPAFEYDPSNVINWGILGAPANFKGVGIDSSGVKWSWEIVNNPLGFIVKDSNGISISPTLTADTTFWFESGYTPNASKTRRVMAFTDVGSAESLAGAAYSLASPPTLLSVIDIGVSSITLTWSANGNPASTVYALDRSTDLSTYFEIKRGTMAELLPAVDRNLDPLRLHRYRVRSINHDGVVTVTTITVQALTYPTPPPIVYSVDPGTVSNLGEALLTVHGDNFLNGATISIHRGNLSSRVIQLSSVTYVNQTRLTGYLNLTGVPAGLWTVEVQNPDRKKSNGSGERILRVTNAPSNSIFTIEHYDPSDSLLLQTPGERTSLVISPSTLRESRIYVSENPEDNPIHSDADLIELANAAMTGWLMVPGTIREIVAFDDNGAVSSNFTGVVELSIPFPDENKDGVVDSITARVENLKLMTLNETRVIWEEVPDSVVNIPAGRIEGRLQHFSLYGLFGALPAAGLNTAYLFPNPWKPGSGGDQDSTRVTFSGLPTSGEIRIFTIEGGLVQTLPFDSSMAGARNWDGRTSEGNLIASGVYLVQIESSDGAKRMLKLGVER